MIVGGSTTSLISLLNEFDYTKYDVDLLLNEMGGALDDQIPPEVTVIDNAYLKINKKTISYIWSFGNAYIKSKLHKKRLVRSQLMAKALAKQQLAAKKEYDVAIAYMEFWPSEYVYQKVSAKKKLLWLHCDYKGAGLVGKYDSDMYSNVDAVVTVSEACNNNFKEIFPSAKSMLIHNILSQNTITALADLFDPDEKLYDADFVFVTVARIDFNSKGHDRGIAVFQRMKSLYPHKSFKWLILGDGVHKAELEELIKSSGLKNEIILLGEQTNPHPYVKKADIFFLPSHYEGKPMAITEAQMNGVVPFVTNYASAKGQIRHMEDGLICENNDDAIIEMMGKIFSGEIGLCLLKQEVQKKDYSNRKEIEKIYKLML